jgi:ribosomal protein L29
MTADEALEWAVKNCEEEAAELAALRADLAYNMLKNSGRLRQLEANRALAEQMKWGE